jgi:hypothetical protein
MSHTDKTRPAWVQVRDPRNRWAMQEEHDHRDGVCDFAEWLKAKDHPWTHRFNCYLDYSYYGINVIKLWARQPTRGHRINRHRVARAQWRVERQRLLAGMDPDDMQPTPDARVYDSWMWEQWRS